MKATKNDIETILNILSETPRQLAVLIDTFEDDHLYTKTGMKIWSVAEILAHMRSCADIWTFSIYTMLTEELPILPDINERKWAKVTTYARLPVALSLQAFTFQREELMRVLHALPLDGCNGSRLSTRVNTPSLASRVAWLYTSRNILNRSGS